MNTAIIETFPLTDNGPRVVNYFESRAAAERYAASRPSGHSHVLELMRATLADELPVSKALDVGCGTGQSTVALLPYAWEVVGIDSSAEMLAQAVRQPRIRYHKAYAEALPFAAGTFDLVSAGSAYHWFDQERFLAEAARVLQPGKWLVLYKAGSTGRMANQPEFDLWRREVLDVRYPKVARNSEALNPARAARFGFRELARETTTREARYSLDQYVENLLTHSSLLRVIEGGLEPAALARAWLRAELAPFFQQGGPVFTHDSSLHILQREG